MPLLGPFQFKVIVTSIVCTCTHFTGKL